MIASHVVLGISLIGFALWLQWTESRGWPNEASDGESDVEYFLRRMRSRRRVNAIFAVCGVLILAASVSGPRVFVIAWLLVTVGLLTVVVLAAFDVVRTQRYMHAKLPEIRRRMLEDDRDRSDQEEKVSRE